MFAIEEGLKKINGEMVETFGREIAEVNTGLEVEAGTNGYKGGICRDAGGRTYLRLEVVCGDFHFSPIWDEDRNMVGVEVAACGDAGLNALMKGLDFAREAIDDQRREVDD